MSFVVDGKAANFIFANLNGTISAWNGNAGARFQADRKRSAHSSPLFSRATLSGRLETICLIWGYTKKRLARRSASGLRLRSI
jgi:hypothetical protein